MSDDLAGLALQPNSDVLSESELIAVQDGVLDAPSAPLDRHGDPRAGPPWWSSSKQIDPSSFPLPVDHAHDHVRTWTLGCVAV